MKCCRSCKIQLIQSIICHTCFMDLGVQPFQKFISQRIQQINKTQQRINNRIIANRDQKKILSKMRYEIRKRNINKLKQQIENKRKAICEAQEKISIYKSVIKQKQGKICSLINSDKLSQQQNELEKKQNEKNRILKQKNIQNVKFKQLHFKNIIKVFYQMNNKAINLQSIISIKQSYFSMIEFNQYKKKKIQSFDINQQSISTIQSLNHFSFTIDLLFYKLFLIITLYNDHQKFQIDFRQILIVSNSDWWHSSFQHSFQKITKNTNYQCKFLITSTNQLLISNVYVRIQLQKSIINIQNHKILSIVVIEIKTGIGGRIYFVLMQILYMNKKCKQQKNNLKDYKSRKNSNQFKNQDLKSKKNSFNQYNDFVYQIFLIIKLQLMQIKQKTNSVFHYLFQQNNILRAENQEFKKILKLSNTNTQLLQIKNHNSLLRQQLLNIKAEILICRQIYQQQQQQRLQLIQQYSVRQRILNQKIIQLQLELELFRNNVAKKNENNFLKPSIELLNMNQEINIFMNLLTNLQQKYEKQKMKRKIAIIKCNKYNKNLPNKSDQDSYNQQSQQSDVENGPTNESTFNYINKNKQSKQIIPKLCMEKAKIVHKLIIQKMENKQKKKKEDTTTLKLQVEQLKDRYTEVTINNFALGKRIDYYNRYITELQQRNQRIIKLKADQMPIQAYELTQRENTKDKH